MTLTDFFAVAAIIISFIALVIPYLTFKRERKKTNQDIIFQEKINSYKDICFSAHEIYTNFFDLVDKVQFYDGEESDWEKLFLDYSGEYYGFSFDFKKKLFQYVTILPNEIFKKAEQLSEHFMGFITTTSHCDSDSTINGYEIIGKQLQELIDFIRTDLNVDKLNIELSKRIE